MIACPYCHRGHRTLRAVARCKWPKAEVVTGDGTWASVSWCRGPLGRSGVSVMLHATKAEAQKAKEFIDATACGGGCTRLHTVEKLLG